MQEIFNNILITPLYNFLIFIITHIPFADLGISIIILTMVVRLILFPLSKNSIKTQIKMKEIQEPLKEIQEKHKGDQQKLATEMMKLYKENNIKPFSGILMLFIQIPIIMALYFVFLNEGLPQVKSEILYFFITPPEIINTTFLGFFDITTKSLVLALLTGVTQFVQARIMFNKTKNEPQKEDIMGDFMKSMQIQMQFVLPIVMMFISYSLGSVIALYFITSNLFSIAQELYLRKKLSKEKEESLVNKIQAPQT